MKIKLCVNGMLNIEETNMAMKSALCLKLSSKCYWIIVLLVCINFWLISKLKLQQSSQDKQQNQLTMVTNGDSASNLTKKLLMKQMSSEIKERSASLEDKPTKSSNEIKDMFKTEIIDVNLGRFDTSRRYKMFDNVIVGDNFVSLSIEYDVTLATQSSLDKLHWISHIIKLVFYIIFQNKILDF